MKRFGNWAVILATLMAVARVGISALANPASEPAPVISAGADDDQAPAAAQPAQSGYLGSETCVVCHENYDKTIELTKHGFRANERTPAAQRGCESCHGPGEAHASDPVNVKPIQLGRVPAAEANAQCLNCHSRGAHALWDGSQHENRNVACRDCHSVHSSE